MIDREYQESVLIILYNTLPTHRDAVQTMQELYQENPDKYVTNIRHLDRKGLVDGNVFISVDGRASVAFPPRLTADGEDYVMNDGGIRKKLDAVSINQDQLNVLIAAIHQSRMADAQKSRLTEALKSLPASALNSIALAALGAMVDCLLDRLGLPHIHRG